MRKRMRRESTIRVSRKMRQYKIIIRRRIERGKKMKYE